MVQKIKVKEYILNDGIGAQMWRKLYAMSYAKHYGLVFEDTVITDFLIHESDQIYNEEQKHYLINRLFSLIDNPWKHLEFLNDNEYVLSNNVGAGLAESQGVTQHSDFLVSASDFSNVTDCDNSIVIHIRRGNVTQENPRWIKDEVYINILKNINLVIEKFEMQNPKIIILTDAPDKEKYYKPISNSQKDMWQQPYLNPNEFGEYVTTSLNFEFIKNEFPNVEIINRLDVYNSFLLMIKAKVLFVSRSAFSQSAGLLSKNNVFGMYECINGFKNMSGLVDQNGDIVFYK